MANLFLDDRERADLPFKVNIQSVAIKEPLSAWAGRPTRAADFEGKDSQAVCALLDLLYKVTAC